MSVHLSCGLTHLLDEGFSSSLQKTKSLAVCLSKLLLTYLLYRDFLNVYLFGKGFDSLTSAVSSTLIEKKSNVLQLILNTFM